jgi:hypothetical protein
MPADIEKISEFYSTPWVREAIYHECENRNVAIRQSWGMIRHYTAADMKRFQGKTPARPLYMDFIQFQSAGTQPDHPADVQFWVNRHTYEFIPEVSTVYDLDRSDYCIIDLDPKDPVLYDFEDTRAATKLVLETLMGPLGDGAPLKRLDLPVTGYKLRFSGNRSFHIYIGFAQRMPLVAMRDAIKKVLDGSLESSMEEPFSVNGKELRLSYHNVRDRKDFILTDIGAIARQRCVRSLYSCHAKTGMVCVPVKNLVAFKRESATIEAVLARGHEPEEYRTGLDGI